MRKILIVDDEISVRDSLRMIFKKDYQVIMASSAEEAIAKVQSEEPDLIFLDIIMPEKDGYEVCEFVKKSPSLSHVPVLLLYADDRCGEVRDALHYLQQPRNDLLRLKRRTQDLTGLVESKQPI